MKKILALACFALVTILPARAQTFSDQLVACTVETSDNHETVVEACTGLIDAGETKGRGLNVLLVRRANAYLKSGNAQAAFADFNRAVKNNPGDVAARLARGRAFFVQGEYDQALDDYEGAIRRSVRPPLEAVTMSCRIRVIAGFNPNQAQNICKRRLRDSPGNPDLLVSRALIRLKVGQFMGAWDDFSEAVRWDPKSVSARYGLGVAALRLGREEEGRKRISDALALDVNVAKEYETYGIVP